MNDIHGVADKVKELIQDRKLYHRISRNALESITPFDWNKINVTWFDEMRKALDKDKQKFR